MWFKNLLVYRLNETKIKADDLEAALRDNALQPCGGFEMETRGWLAPRGGDQFLHALQRDRKSTRLNSSHIPLSRMPSSA